MDDFMKMFNQMPKMDQKRQLDDLDETNKKKKKLDSDVGNIVVGNVVIQNNKKRQLDVLEVPIPLKKNKKDEEIEIIPNIIKKQK